MRLRLLVLALLCLTAPSHAHAAVETVVHMLDYVSVDYPEFVKHGKVLDETDGSILVGFGVGVAVLALVALLTLRYWDEPPRTRRVSHGSNAVRPGIHRAPGVRLIIFHAQSESPEPCASSRPRVLKDYRQPANELPLE